MAAVTFTTLNTQGGALHFLPREGRVFGKPSVRGAVGREGAGGEGGGEWCVPECILGF